MAEHKRPLLCRLGFHEWYLDAAMFTHAERCGRCPAVRNERAAKRLDAERTAWGEGEDGESLGDAMARVARRLSKAG